MEYFEQIRLLFILFMAYLSYRNLPNYSNQIANYAIQSEQQDQNIQNTNQPQMEEQCQVVPNNQTIPQISSNEHVNSIQCPLQLGSNQPNILQTDQSPMVEALKIVQKHERALTPIDQNQVICPKVGKTKPIKKFWRKEKKQSNTQTVIASDVNEQQQGEEQPALVIDYM